MNSNKPKPVLTHKRNKIEHIFPIRDNSIKNLRI